MKKEEIWRKIENARSGTPVVFSKHYYDSLLARGITGVGSMHREISEVDDEMRHAIKKQGEFYPSEVLGEGEYNKWYCVFQRDNREIIKLPTLNKYDKIQKCYVNLIKNVMRISESERIMLSRAKQNLYNRHMYHNNDTGGEK